MHQGEDHILDQDPEVDPDHQEGEDIAGLEVEVEAEVGLQCHLEKDM